MELRELNILKQNSSSAHFMFNISNVTILFGALLFRIFMTLFINIAILTVYKSFIYCLVTKEHYSCIDTLTFIIRDVASCRSPMV